ncbi:MAG: hypothetical protein IH984_06410 [Planctomycetes bacterium]|nr:hypothetical protein [Planctomycetota bacterium]
MHTEPDICANQTLEAIDLENFEQFTMQADNLIDAVMELAKLLGVDWADM